MVLEATDWKEGLKEMTQRIVLPLDQSDVSESAIPMAKALAGQLGASLTLLTVVDAPSSLHRYVRTDERDHTGRRPPGIERPTDITAQSPYGNWTGSTSSEPSARQIEQVASASAEAEAYLKRISESFGDMHVETAVRLGSPADRILETAETRENALIVLASHGRSGIRRAVAGSVALRVVQGSSSPVIVVRANTVDDTAQSPQPVRKVLIPVDGSALSEQAIPQVQGIFGADNLEIHLTSVIETPRFANQRQTEDYVGWLAGQVGKAGSKTTWDVSTGSPSIMINKAAEAQDVDMIAMSTLGRSGLSRFVLGSVAERVLHEADRPLMLIPARA